VHLRYRSEEEDELTGDDLLRTLDKMSAAEAEWKASGWRLSRCSAKKGRDS
jgi:hypothetical protein